MSAPLVSICLPNLNTLPYLRERADTILAQTYTNWELVVSDNYSEDGAWEFFEKLAHEDSRVSIAQAPREGMYANWNRCVERARGEYVYVATSDDGMAPDCLEKLVAALESHPECDVGHCPLVVVDEHGTPLPNRWWRRGMFDRSLPELVDRLHVRRAPYDGLLCFTGQQVYYSITELLIRRSLFSRIGAFETRWGSVSDFNWYTRVGLAANVVHVPDTWASWRIHPHQATASASLKTPEHDRKVDEMLAHAMARCSPFFTPAVAGRLQEWAEQARDLRAYYAGVRDRHGLVARRLFQLSHLVSGTKATRAEVVGRVTGKEQWPAIAHEEIRAMVESLELGPIAASEIPFPSQTPADTVVPASS
jgi:hypothetical protein